MDSSPSSRLFFLPDALTTNLGHRAGCRLHFVSLRDSEPISPAAARGDAGDGWGCRGVRHGPPAFRLRAHMSIAARGFGPPGLDWKRERERDREYRSLRALVRVPAARTKKQRNEILKFFSLPQRDIQVGGPFIRQATVEGKTQSHRPVHLRWMAASSQCLEIQIKRKR